MKRVVCMSVFAFAVAVGTVRARGQEPDALAPIAVWPSADGKYQLPRRENRQTLTCALPDGLVRLADQRIEVDQNTERAGWRAESFALSIVTGDDDDCESGPTQLVTFLPPTLNRRMPSAPSEHQISWSPMTPESVSVRIESPLFANDRTVREAHVLRLATEAGLVLLTATRRDGNYYHYSGHLSAPQRDALLSTQRPLLRVDVSLVDELPTSTRLVRGGNELTVRHASYELPWQTPAAPWRAHVDLTPTGELPLDFSWAAAVTQVTTAPASNGLSNASVDVADRLRGTPSAWSFSNLPDGTTDIAVEVSTVMGSGKIAVSVGRQNVVSFNVVASDNTSTWQVSALPGRFKLCERSEAERWRALRSWQLPKNEALPREVPVHVTTARTCTQDTVRPANVTVYAPAAVGANQRANANVLLDLDPAHPERLRVWVSGEELLLRGTVIEWRGRSVSGEWGDCSGDACAYELRVPAGVGNSARIPLEFSVAGLAPGATVHNAAGRDIDHPSYTVVATKWKAPTRLRRLVPLLSAAPSTRFEVASHPAFRFLRTDHELKCKLTSSAAFTTCGRVSRTGPASVTFQLTNNDARTRLSASDQSLEVEVHGVEEFGGKLTIELFTAACNFEFVQRSPLISGVEGGQVWFEVHADSLSCVSAPLKLANSATLAFGLGGWREAAWTGRGRSRRFWVTDVVKVDVTNGAHVEAAVLFSNDTRADGVGTSQAVVRLDIRPPVRWSDVGLDVEVPVPGVTEPTLLRHAEQLGLNRRNFLRVPRQDGLPWRVFVLDHGAFEPCGSNWETQAYEAPPQRQVYPADASNDDELTGRGVANGYPAYCFRPRHRVSDNKLRVEFRLEPLLSDLLDLDAGWSNELRNARVRVGSRRLAPTKEAKTYMFPMALTSGTLRCGDHPAEQNVRIEPDLSPVPVRERELGSCEVGISIPENSCGPNGIITTQSPQALRLQLHIRPSGGTPKDPRTLRDVVIGAGHSVPGVSCAGAEATVQLGTLVPGGVDVSAYDEVSVEIAHLSAGERSGQLQSSRTFMPDNYAPAAATHLEFRARYVPNSNILHPFRRGEDRQYRSSYGLRLFLSAHVGLGMTRYPHSGRSSTMSSELRGTESFEIDYGIVVVGEFWDFGTNDAPWPVLNPQFHLGVLLPKSEANDFAIVAGLGLRIPLANTPGTTGLPLQFLPTLWYELSWVNGSPFHAMVFGVRLTAGMVLGN